MIRKITSLVFAAFAMAATAFADGYLTFNWAHSVDGQTTSGDNFIAMDKALDGNYFVCTQFSTTDKTLNVKFDGETLTDASGTPIEGSTYDTSAGASQNRNMLLQKVNAQTGAVEWFAYTKKGDVEQTSTSVKGTADGGAVMTVKTRAWQPNAGLDNLLEFVDATGATTTVKDMWTKKGEYRFLLLKLDKSGKLEWTRLICGQTYDAGEAGYKYATKENAYTYGLDSDADGNIYICGNFRTKLFLRTAEGAVDTLVAKSNVNWTGDSQLSVGDLFIAKFDKNGYVTGTLTTEGVADCAFFDNLIVSDGKIYLNGRVKGDALTLGGKAIAASADRQTMIFASVNASDLSVNYVKAITSAPDTRNRFALQNKNMQLVDGSLYSTGLITGGFSDGDKVFLDNTKSNMYKAYMLKVDPATGDVVNSLVRLDGGIGGNFGVYVGKNNTYTFGYDMAKGALLTKYDNQKYEKVDEVQICSYGTIALCAAPIIDGDNFVMMNRGGMANNFTNEASFYGTDTKFTNLACWGTVYYSYKIDDTVTTAVTDVSAEGKAGNYDVYTVGGVLLKQASSYDEAVKGLAAGVYVIGDQKVTLK